jgi:hypothetical protein
MYATFYLLRSLMINFGTCPMQKLNLGRVQRSSLMQLRRRFFLFLQAGALSCTIRFANLFALEIAFLSQMNLHQIPPFQIFRKTFVSTNHLVGESFRFSNSSTNLRTNKISNICQNPTNCSMHKSKCISFTKKILLLWKLLDQQTTLIQNLLAV